LGVGIDFPEIGRIVEFNAPNNKNLTTMKKNLLIIILLISINSFSQSFTEFKNDNLKIEFPETWIVLPKEKMPQLALVAYRKPENSVDRAQVTININIINIPNSSLDKTYSDLVDSISEVENFKLLKNGNVDISSQPFKWLIESHSNYKDKNQQMHNYVFVTYKNDKAYILTMASFSEVFDTYKSIFDKISKSLIIN
jgi:hypothetical protein